MTESNVLERVDCTEIVHPKHKNFLTHINDNVIFEVDYFNLAYINYVTFLYLKKLDLLYNK